MKAETLKSHQERVVRVLVNIESALSGDLSLEALARHANLSPYHFHRVFTALVGEAPSEYVRRLRLERAAHDLVFGSRPIIRVASDAGYESHASFTRAFRAAFGTAPSDYRRANQPRTFSPTVSSAARDQPPSTFSLPFATKSRLGRVERLPRLRVAFVRHVGPYEAVPPVFSRLSGWVRERDRAHADVMRIGMPHDNPRVTPPERLRFDCCVLVASAIEPEGEVGIREIGGESYATTTHHGSFDRLAETYGWLGREFIPASGMLLRRSPAIEIYLNDPETTPPDQLLTDLLLPVEKSPPGRARGTRSRRMRTP